MRSDATLSEKTLLSAEIMSEYQENVLSEIPPLPQVLWKIVGKTNVTQTKIGTT